MLNHNYCVRSNIFESSGELSGDGSTVIFEFSCTVEYLGSVEELVSFLVNTTFVVFTRGDKFSTSMPSATPPFMLNLHKERKTRQVSLCPKEGNDYMSWIWFLVTKC